MKCILKDLTQVKPGHFIAWIRRLEEHPKLGPPVDMLTQTSEIKYIDFEHGLIITQNSTYTFNGCNMDPRNPPDHLYQIMLFTRQLLSEDVKKLPRHEQVLVEQHIAELDGYLTIQAPMRSMQ